MIRAGRSTQTVEHLTPRGGPVRLVAQTWWAGVTVGSTGAGFTYRRPVRLEAGGESRAIVDPLGIVRLVALTAVVTAVVWRRRKS